MSLISEVNDSIAGLPGTTRARRVIVVRALGALDSLARETHGERGLEYDLAEAYLKVGDVQGQPYRPNLGETRAALESYTKARNILATVLASDSRDMRTREGLIAA